MAKLLEVRQMAEFIMGLEKPIARAANVALLETVLAAKAKAVRNANENFKGTRDRPKTGNLANAIFEGFELGSSEMSTEGFVGVRSKKGSKGTRPYGRIHEFGGTIRPVKAKYLWIPLFGPKSSGQLGRFRNLTPSEFIRMMEEGDAFMRFSMTGNGWVAVVANEWTGFDVVPVFNLVKEAVMPARPYVMPAVEEEYDKLPDRIKKHFERGT